jgi:hypothetical protein
LAFYFGFTGIYADIRKDGLPDSFQFGLQEIRGVHQGVEGQILDDGMLTINGIIHEKSLD